MNRAWKSLRTLCNDIRKMHTTQYLSGNKKCLLVSLVKGKKTQTQYKKPRTGQKMFNQNLKLKLTQHKF